MSYEVHQEEKEFSTHKRIFVDSFSFYRDEKEKDFRKKIKVEFAICFGVFLLNQKLAQSFIVKVIVGC